MTNEEAEIIRKKLEAEIIKHQKELQSLSLEEKNKRLKIEFFKANKSIEKIFNYILKYPNSSTDYFFEKLNKIKKKLDEKENILKIKDWDFLWLHLLKISNSIDDDKINFDIYNCYNYASEILGGYNEDLAFLFYELCVFHKKEATEIINGNRSEKIIFKNAEQIIKKYIPTFTNGIKEKNISGKRIDLLGVCSETKKYIIVEFKKSNRDATNQLYSYDRLLGGGNILVSLTEKEIPKKHNGIIYLDLETYHKNCKGK